MGGGRRAVWAEGGMGGMGGERIRLWEGMGCDRWMARVRRWVVGGTSCGMGNGGDGKGMGRGSGIGIAIFGR